MTWLKAKESFDGWERLRRTPDEIQIGKKNLDDTWAEMKSHSFTWELATAKISTVHIRSVTVHLGTCHRKKIRPSGLQVSQCHLGACHLKNVSLLVWSFVSFIWGRATARMSAVQIANVVVSSRNLALIFNCLVRFSLGTVIFLRGHFYFQLFGWFFWALSFY